jgi:murein lipoprotein
MVKLNTRLTRVAAVMAVFGLMAGCATAAKEEGMDAMKAAEQAQKEAAQAKALASDANAKANQALKIANEAKAQSEATDAKIDNMFKKAMQK